MYRNFKISDEERKQILESHMAHGYKKPLNENSYENWQDSLKSKLEQLTKDEGEYQKALDFWEGNVDDVEFHYDPRGDFDAGVNDAAKFIIGMIRGGESNSPFSDEKDLLVSIKDRLATATQMNDWDLVNEVLKDVMGFTKQYENKTDYKLPDFGDTMGKLDQLTIRESFWNSIFGKPNVKDAAHTQMRAQGYSHIGKDEERKDENYLVFQGQKFYPEQIEYADYQDLGELPRIQDGKLIIANPGWSL